MYEQPSKRAATRREVLQRLTEELHTDERLAGLVLVGSGANGFRDDEVDIDLVAPVTDPADVTAVFRHWKARIDSQEELANLVGVTRQTISSIETWQYTPSALLAFLLAQKLEKPVQDLFFLEGGES